MHRLSAAVVASLLALAGLAACGGGDPTAPTGSALPAASVTGTWIATLANPACTGGPLTFVVTGADADVQPFGSLSFTSTWATATATGPLYGTFNLRTRTVALRLFATTDTEHGASLDGELDQSLNLAGHWTDPYATLAPLLGGGPCGSLLTAVRSAPAE